MCAAQRRERTNRCDAAQLPARYLVDELSLLEPGVLIVVGRWVGDALAQRVVVERSEQHPGLRRGTATIGGRKVEILCCNHPSYGNWKPTIASLRQTLAEHPLVVRS